MGDLMSSDGSTDPFHDGVTILSLAFFHLGLLQIAAECRAVFAGVLLATVPLDVLSISI